MNFEHNSFGIKELLTRQLLARSVDAFVELKRY